MATLCIGVILRLRQRPAFANVCSLRVRSKQSEMAVGVQKVRHACMVGVVALNKGIVWRTAVAQSEHVLNALMDLPSSKTGLPVAFGSVLDM